MKQYVITHSGGTEIVKAKSKEEAQAIFEALTGIKVVTVK